jgi:type IV pilus assembly protein PilF
MMLRVTYLIVLLFLSGCTSVPEQNKTSAGFNVQLGVAYMEQGQMERAKQKLLLALKQAPTWPPALDAMALYAEKTGDIDAAKQYYLRSLAIAPNDGSVQNNYGAFLCRTGHLQEAETYFLRAAQDKTYLSTAEAYENAGLCALKIPNRKKAIFYFEKALLHSPGRAKTIQELHAAKSVSETS